MDTTDETLAATGFLQIDGMAPRGRDLEVEPPLEEALERLDDPDLEVLVRRRIEDEPTTWDRLVAVGLVARHREASAARRREILEAVRSGDVGGLKREPSPEKLWMESQSHDVVDYAGRRLAEAALSAEERAASLPDDLAAADTLDDGLVRRLRELLESRETVESVRALLEHNGEDRLEIPVERLDGLGTRCLEALESLDSADVDVPDSTLLDRALGAAADRWWADAWAHLSA